MHILEKAFIDLLRNHLTTISNEKIYAGTRYRPIDITPCVNVSLAAENFLLQRFTEIGTVQYLQKKYDAELWINIYANSEEERQNLIDEVHTRILQAETHHYTTCANFIFETQKCSETNERCAALTVHNTRTIKNQCPNLEIYNPFFKDNNIIRRTFCVNNILDLDDYEPTETVLRTIIKLNMEYYSFYKIGGKPFNNLQISEELL